MQQASQTDSHKQQAQPKKNWSMLAAVLGAIGASICCVGPLLLLALGFSGAWISYLPALEPLRPWFIGLTLVFLGLAFYQLYLKPQACEVDKPCANPKVIRNQRIIFWVVSVLLLALLAFPWYAPIFY